MSMYEETRHHLIVWGVMIILVFTLGPLAYYMLIKLFEAIGWWVWILVPVTIGAGMIAFAKYDEWKERREEEKEEADAKLRGY